MRTLTLLKTPTTKLGHLYHFWIDKFFKPILGVKSLNRCNRRMKPCAKACSECF